MPFNLLLLPLLGGFIFVRFWNRTRAQALRDDKDRLLLKASFVGLLALIIAFFLAALAASLIPCDTDLPCLAHWWGQEVPFEHAGVSLLAFVLGATLWYPLNFFWDKDAEIARLIEEDANPFEILLKEAQERAETVLVTMKNNKVYMGWVSILFNPALPMKFIGIVPTKSGYRNEIDKGITFTLDYSKTYEAIESAYEQKDQELETLRTSATPSTEQISNLENELNDLDSVMDKFKVIIPVDEIVSIIKYDEKVHKTYLLPSPAERYGPARVTVQITSEPPGADVHVDNVFSCSTPSSLALLPGEHVFKVSRLQYKDWERTVSVDPDSVQRLNAVLQSV